MNKKSLSLLLLTVLILNLAFRFNLISKGPYHSDCLFLTLQAENVLKTGQLQYVQGGGLPLTVLSASLFIWIGQQMGLTDPVFAVNLMSVVFSSLSIVALFLFVNSCVNGLVALISSVLLALHPLYLALSTFGNSHPPTMFFFFLGLWMLSETFKSRPKLVILSGLCFGLMAAFRLQDFFIVLPAIMAFVVFPPTPYKMNGSPLHQRLSMLTVLMAISLLVASFFYLPALIATNAAAKNVAPLINSRFLDYLLPFSWPRLRTLLGYFFAMFSPVECIFAALALPILIKKDKHLAIFLLLWLFMPQLLLTQLRFYELRLTVIAIVPLIMLCGYALSLLPQSKRLSYGLVALTITLVIVNLMTYYPRIYFRHQHDLLPQYFRWVGTLTEPNAYIIEKDHIYFIDYYARRKAILVAEQVAGPSAQSLRDFQKQLDDLLDRQIPVYITEYGLNYGGFKEWMRSRYTLKRLGSRPMEDWRRGALFQIILPNALFKIEKKSIPPEFAVFRPILDLKRLATKLKA